MKRIGTGIKVEWKNSVPHPMEEKYHIQWIEVIANGQSMRVLSKAWYKPEAEFPCDDNDIIVRAYCNIHGLWRSA